AAGPGGASSGRDDGDDDRPATKDTIPAAESIETISLAISRDSGVSERGRVVAALGNAIAPVASNKNAASSAPSRPPAAVRAIDARPSPSPSPNANPAARPAAPQMTPCTSIGTPRP